MKRTCPDEFDERTVCLSVDVDWASREAVADLRLLLDERGLKATFFVTHAGVDVPGHERGIHPNFRRAGDTIKALMATMPTGTSPEEPDIYRHVVNTSKSFAPEAKGVRAHSLYYDSLLMPTYREHGLEYDSSYQIPLLSDLRPFWKECDILEIPIYFNDHFELKTGATGFDVKNLKLDQPGLKVILVHPNIVTLNASTNDQYLACKPYYHDYERLVAARHAGRGIRTLLMELLDTLGKKSIATMTIGDVNKQWRHTRRWQ